MSFSTEGIQVSALISQALLAVLGGGETATEEADSIFEENLSLASEKTLKEGEDFKEILNREEDLSFLPGVIPLAEFSENKIEGFAASDLPQDLLQSVDFHGENDPFFSPFLQSSAPSSTFLSERELERAENPHEQESPNFLDAAQKKDRSVLPPDFSEEGENVAQHVEEIQRSQKLSSDLIQQASFQDALEKEAQKIPLFSQEEAFSVSLKQEKNTEKNREIDSLDLLPSNENPDTSSQESKTQDPNKVSLTRFQEKTSSSSTLELKETEGAVKSSISRVSGNEKSHKEEKILFEPKDFSQKGIEGGLEKNFSLSWTSAIQHSNPSGGLLPGHMSAVLRQISENYAGMIRGQGADGSSFVRFQLHPESLGVLEIHLVFHQETLSLKFSGEPSTMELLQRHALQLAEALHQQGFQLNSDQMNFGSLPWRESLSHSGEQGKNPAQFFEGEQQERRNQVSTRPSLSSTPSPSERINILIDTSLTQITTPGEIALCL